MRTPAELFTLHREVQFDERPILLYAFSGFVDAGSGVRLAAEHILAVPGGSKHLVAPAAKNDVLAPISARCHTSDPPHK